MTPGLRIGKATTKTDWAAVVALCWAYRDFLLSQPEPDQRAVLNAYPVDRYTALMDELPQLHSVPTGAAMLVRREDQVLGCGMYYQFEPGIAEVKRVFITEDARGSGTGRALMEALIAECRAAGFRKMYLDTGRLLRGAITLYQQLGFTPRGPYHDVPDDLVDLLRFFELDL